MKSKKYVTKKVLGNALSAMVLFSLPAFSATAEESYYQSKSQADIGYMNALQQSDLTNNRLHEQMIAVNEAESQMREMRSSRNTGQMHSAENAVHDAEADLSATMSQMTGISQAEIEAMHDTGMSWEQLSREVGIKTPGGLSHSSRQAAGMMNDRNAAGKRQNRQSGNMTVRTSETASSGMGYMDSSGSYSSAGMNSQSGYHQYSGEASESSAINHNDSTNMGPGTQQGQGLPGNEDTAGRQQQKRQADSMRGRTQVSGNAATETNRSANPSGSGTKQAGSDMSQAQSGVHQTDGNASGFTAMQQEMETADMSSGTTAMRGVHSTGTGSENAAMQDPMSFQNSDRLSPMAEGMNTRPSRSAGLNQRMAGNDTSSQQFAGMDSMGNMEGHGISGAEMDAATARNTMNGGVSGHGTDVNSGGDHGSGSMMGGTGGLDGGMGSGGAGSGGMGGSSSGGMGGGSAGGGLGGSDSGMGSSGGGTGGSGGGMGGSGGGMGGSGGGMGGSGGGSGGSGGGGGGMM